MKKLGDVVRAKRRQMGLSQTAFGALIGQSQATVSDWEKGKISYPRNYERLSAVLGIPVDELLGMLATAGIATGKTERIPPSTRASIKKMSGPALSNYVEVRTDPNMGLRDVPVFGRAQGGPDGKFEFNGEIMGYEMRPPSLLGVSDAYALYVDGDSMYPRFKPGETVWVNPSRPAARGDDVIVQLHANEEDGTPIGFIKEFVSRTPNHLVLCQHNPAREVRFALNEVKSVHTIVLAQRS